MNPNRTRAEETARALLLKQASLRLPVRAERLSFEREIMIDSMQRFCRITAMTVDELSHGTDCLKDGCTLALPGSRYLILYNNSSRSLRRRNFTLAHELGHIYLDHKQDRDAEEQEANCFAAELIIPRILADALLESLPDGLDPAGALSEAFFVSDAMAQVRLRTMYRELSFSDMEKALLNKFGARLPRHKEPIVTW